MYKIQGYRINKLLPCFQFNSHLLNSPIMSQLLHSAPIIPHTSKIVHQLKQEMFSKHLTNIPLKDGFSDITDSKIELLNLPQQLFSSVPSSPTSRSIVFQNGLLMSSYVHFINQPGIAGLHGLAQPNLLPLFGYVLNYLLMNIVF